MVRRAASGRSCTSRDARLLAGLESLGSQTYELKGPEGRTAAVSFNLPGRHAKAVVESLAARDIAVAHGHYYALMMRRLELESFLEALASL